MEKIPNKVFHGSPELFDSEVARPKRQIRTSFDEFHNEVVIFDEESFHATPHRWVALAYMYKPAPIERDNIRGSYSMGVNLYNNEKSLLIVGIGSLEVSLEILYGSGGYLYHFDESFFSSKEGLGALEVVSGKEVTPLEVERVSDPVTDLKELGVTFEFVDISLDENEHFRD